VEWSATQWQYVKPLRGKRTPQDLVVSKSEVWTVERDFALSPES